MKLFVEGLLLWNVITFLMMGIDKRRSIKNKKRISEKTLIVSSFFMGAAGTCLGAVVFHHKTRKMKFRILLPLSLVINIAAIYVFNSINII